MAPDGDPANLEAWLVLLRTPGLGAVSLRALLEHHGSASSALAAVRRGELPRALDEAGRDWLRAPDRQRLEADFAWLGEPGHSLLACDAPDFPALLAESPGAPAALFVAGDASLLWRPQVAIVGSRAAGQAGLATARNFSRALSAAGFVVTSGLALGIDAAAHEAALDADAPTIAVLGTGPDLTYPPRHRGLAARIATRGALVSEFPPGTSAQASHFPRRNRIIAGLALGTLVVEADLRSGSLITARNATEAGREVFAVPGSIHNPRARGCHRLIRDGAHLVETAAEIVDELAPRARQLGAELRARLDAEGDAIGGGPAGLVASPRERDPDYARLLRALGEDALSIDALVERTGLDVTAVSSMLLMLELEDVVVSSCGTFARRVTG